MIGNIFKVLISVKAKLFFGFFSMVMIIALLGGYAFNSMTNASNVVEETFDRPLMAINFARSASQVFGQLEIATLEQGRLTSEDKQVHYDDIIPLLNQFKEDLNVAKERSISSRADSFFEDITKNLTLWESGVLGSDQTRASPNMENAQTYADIIKDQLDIIVELQTNESFRAREKSISRMVQIRQYNLWAVGLALAITLLLSAWIAVTIIQPLKAAALAARKISAGNFNAVIPPGGDDETGVLLKTMSAMQENIRNRVDKEQNAKTLAQHRLSDSLRNSKDAILLTNTEGQIIVSNPKVKDVFPSLKPIELVNENFSDHFHSEGYSFNDAASYQKGSSEINFDDGRWARVSASKTQEGGCLYIWTDITEVKKYADQLTSAKEEAEAADKAKTLFLAAMSHELRTPLNAVIGFSDVLKHQYSGPDGNSNHAEMASLISQNGAQLLNIVKDVLMVANGANSENMPMDKSELEMSDIVNFCTKTIFDDAKKHDIRLLWVPTHDDYQVYGDPLRLQQLLLNLLSNAIKYNEPGGLVKIKLSKTQEYELRLDVIDNGIGIDESNIDRIMEPFIQVDIGHTRKYDGVGVGLTIVNKILKAHNGRLKVLSKLGQGTCVSIYLPLLTQSQSTPSKDRGYDTNT